MDNKITMFMIIALAKKLKLSPEEFTRAFTMSDKDVSDYMKRITIEQLKMLNEKTSEFTDLIKKNSKKK